MLCAMCTKNNRYAHRNAKKKLVYFPRKKQEDFGVETLFCIGLT